jgi:Putative transposase
VYYRLCRYITRPALANERLKINAKGQVELKLKSRWRDGTTHLVMSLLEFMQRQAALVPRPRLYLIRFHGITIPAPKRSLDNHVCLAALAGVAIASQLRFNLAANC